MQYVHSLFNRTYCIFRSNTLSTTIVISNLPISILLILILDIWLAVHHNITFLLLPTWYTNFLFIYTSYNKLNSSTCFERIPPIIRRSTTQIVHMQPLVLSLSAGDCLVQPLRKDSSFLPSFLPSFLGGCTRQSPAESGDTRGCICTICVADLLMMGGMRSKHVEEFNLLELV
jgi:hypothetical protein